MNVKELSVGNYVFATEAEGSDDQPNGMVTRYPIMIDTIFGDTILDNYGMERDIEQLEPIPITPEILLQSGFEKHCDMYGIYDDYNDFELHEISDGMWSLTFHICEFALPDSSTIVGAIHDLQRLMVFFAIDKEIKIELNEQTEL